MADEASLDSPATYGPADAPPGDQLPPLVRGWTSTDGRRAAPDGPTHAVRPDPLRAPVAGPTECGHYAHLDWMRRPWTPEVERACPDCLAALDETQQ